MLYAVVSGWFATYTLLNQQFANVRIHQCKQCAGINTALAFEAQEAEHGSLWRRDHAVSLLPAGAYWLMLLRGLPSHIRTGGCAARVCFDTKTPPAAYHHAVGSDAICAAVMLNMQMWWWRHSLLIMMIWSIYPGSLPT